MLRTAVTHWPKVRAPCGFGLNCLVRMPSPCRFITTPITVFTGAAGPDQVCRTVVFFVAVRVMRLDVSSRTTESADTRPSREAFWSVGAVARRAVCDLSIRLAPGLSASAQRIRAHQQLGGIFATERIFVAWMEHLDGDPGASCVQAGRKRHTDAMRSGFHELHVPARRSHCHMLNGEFSRHRFSAQMAPQ